MARNKSHLTKDRRAAIGHHGKACVKCGFDQRIEVHHINGYEDRDINNMHPLCKYCHLIAPMGEEYWRWLEHGEAGTDNLLRIAGSLFANLTDEDSLKLVHVLKQMAVDGPRKYNSFSKA